MLAIAIINIFVSLQFHNFVHKPIAWQQARVIA